MAEEKNLSLEASESKAKPEKKQKNKPSSKRPNFFVRVWKKLCKFCKDTVGELKKVVWTPKNELRKSTKLVIVTVVALSVAIAIVDTLCSWVINSFAGMIG
jgi:preprotein translocase subunit SecE